MNQTADALIGAPPLFGAGDLDLQFAPVLEQQVSAYAKFFDRSPDKLGPQDVRAHQIHLVQVRKLEASSVGIATSALRFLYTVTLKQTWAPNDIPMPSKPFKLPVVRSPGEVMHFLQSVDSLKNRTILMTAYAAGLRVSEAAHLQVTDMDSQRMVLRVDQGRNRKDSKVMLSPRLLEELRVYWKARRGSCPSCGARHIAQAAAHLVDHAFHHLPAHPWQIDRQETAVRGCRVALQPGRTTFFMPVVQF